jgi:hypothetical protein
MKKAKYMVQLTGERSVKDALVLSSSFVTIKAFSAHHASEVALAKTKMPGAVVVETLYLAY